MKSGLHGRERLPKVLEREGVVAKEALHRRLRERKIKWMKEKNSL
jgi:hypothetical protein